MRRKIKKVLEDVRPYLQSDGGDVIFVDYIDGVVTLRLIGACVGCPSSTATLKGGIERRLRQELPVIQEVVTVQ